jgi:hypothetical protein
MQPDRTAEATALVLTTAAGLTGTAPPARIHGYACADVEVHPSSDGNDSAGQLMPERDRRRLTGEGMGARANEERAVAILGEIGPADSTQGNRKRRHSGARGSGFGDVIEADVAWAVPAQRAHR